MTIPHRWDDGFFHWYGYHIPWAEVEKLNHLRGLEFSVALKERANELGIVSTIPLPDNFPYYIYG